MASNNTLSQLEEFKSGVEYKNTRIEWVDISKGIGILLVVWAHVHDSGNLCIIIYSFHMPLFLCYRGICLTLINIMVYGNF